MRFYNTLTRQIDEFIPQSFPDVTMYTCGPTVYDYQHVGNWFNYIRMDILVRTLRASNFKVNWVMNVTDVGHLTSDSDDGQDKIEKGAIREHKTAWQVAEFYTLDFIKSMEELDIIKPTRLVKATDHIQDQIDMIKQLMAKDYCYIIDDGVYFDTSKFPSYSDFARLDVDEQQAGIRVKFNSQKRNTSDFVVWKFSKTKRDMIWDSPWGKGFPGWHIECSAMSMKYLGETLDIHSGGIDHIPIHHTNEIAQSQALTGKPLANYWFHSNHITINNQKISKSLNNGLNLSQIKELGYRPDDLRINVLESHYKSQSKFSIEGLAAAANRLKDLEAMAALRWQAREVVHDAATFALCDVEIEIVKYLEDDLATPGLMSYLSQVSQELQTVLINKKMQIYFIAMLEAIDRLLGLHLTKILDITGQQKDLINLRLELRHRKQWIQADAIRQKLAKQGIGIKDMADRFSPTEDDDFTIWYYM